MIKSGSKKEVGKWVEIKKVSGKCVEIIEKRE